MEITWFREIKETLLKEISLFSELVWNHPPELQYAYVRSRGPLHPPIIPENLISRGNIGL